MNRPVCKNPMILGCKAEPATAQDLPVAIDLKDTLRAHLHECVGMAANMIGVPKAIIAIAVGPAILVMLNPVIMQRKDPFEAEEGCLSLSGVRKTTRYRTITVSYQDLALKQHKTVYTGFTAQIIQHETDHLQGILI